MGKRPTIYCRPGKMQWTGGEPITQLGFVAGLNGAVAFLLLFGTVQLLGGAKAGLRLFAAAVFCALWLGMAMLWWPWLLDKLFWRWAGFSLCIWIAFGFGKSMLKGGSVFLLLNLALAGLMHMVPGSGGGSAAVYAGAIVLLCRFLVGGTGICGGYSRLVIRHLGKTVSLRAFRDSGNKLRDPLTGERIVVLGPGPASELTGLTPEQLAHPVETAAAGGVRGLRLVSYSTVGNKSGLMLALRFRDAAVDGVPCSIVVGLASEGMGNFDALIGG